VEVERQLGGEAERLPRRSRLVDRRRPREGAAKRGG